MLAEAPARPMTQYEVAKVLGLSRGRIVQIEKAAVAKLAKALGLPVPARYMGAPKR